MTEAKDIADNWLRSTEATTATVPAGSTSFHQTTPCVPEKVYAQDQSHGLNHKNNDHHHHHHHHLFEHHPKLYRGHRAKSLDVTEAELVEIRARERTFDGAYWRTALKSFSSGMMILRLFTADFYAIGLLFVVFGMSLLGLAALRRRICGDMFDQNAPFQTSGFVVLLTTIVSTIAYVTLFVLVMRVP